MRITIFGLGYVGCVSLACLSKDGHDVIGVDINDSKIDIINNGIPTIIEKDVDQIIREQWELGRIEATKDYVRALENSDISMICVGTPSASTGHLDMSSVFHVAENIGKGILKNNKFHTVVIRSTVMPGTNQKIGSIIEKCSRKKRGENFEVVSNPEFLREGSAVEDYYNPPMTVIGTYSESAFDIMVNLYDSVNGSKKKTSIKVAEMIKFVNNSFHALKVTFANEIGIICKQLEIDSYDVMELFCEDNKLNLSAYYLKPGFSYGGSCLPKDLKALSMMAHDRYLETIVLGAIEKSNNRQKERLLQLIQKKGCKKIGILGLSFKAGTDDLRCSPIVDVTEMLIGKGYELKIYDQKVHLSNLIGANKEYIDEKIPHIEKLISNNLETVINQSDLLIITNKEDEFNNILELYPDKMIIDLARINRNIPRDNEKYEGICW